MATPPTPERQPSGPEPGVRPPTIRDLARLCGLSTATVSIALRGSPRVRPETATRVMAAAEAAGYRPDPMVATLMARVRQRRPADGGATLALVYVGEDHRKIRQYGFFNEILAGAEERAVELGFRTEMFSLLAPGMTPKRMSSILHSRGVPGVILPPVPGRTEHVELDWEKFASVAVGYSLKNLHLHRVCPDQYQGIQLMIQKLTALGYRRIGLVIDLFTDRRVDRKWTAAMYRHNADAGTNAVPVFLFEAVLREPFLRWFRRHRPDVVVAPTMIVMNWLAEEGIPCPADVGFAHVNWAERSAPCGGIDQRPRLLGAAAVDSVVSQIHRNERGLPAAAHTLMIEAAWADGPTLRSA